MQAANIYERMALASLALRQAALGSTAAFGPPPTAEELAEGGGHCPICQDAYRSPVRLPCNHIFCADCLGEW